MGVCSCASRGRDSVYRTPVELTTRRAPVPSDAPRRPSARPCAQVGGVIAGDTDTAATGGPAEAGSSADDRPELLALSIVPCCARETRTRRQAPSQGARRRERACVRAEPKRCSCVENGGGRGDAAARREAATACIVRLPSPHALSPCSLRRPTATTPRVAARRAAARLRRARISRRRALHQRRARRRRSALGCSLGSPPSRSLARRYGLKGGRARPPRPRRATRSRPGAHQAQMARRPDRRSTRSERLQSASGTCTDARRQRPRAGACRRRS
jgi:hypothetical protein